jgi:hypothetical protein
MILALRLYCCKRAADGLMSPNAIELPFLHELNPVNDDFARTAACVDTDQGDAKAEARVSPVPLADIRCWRLFAFDYTRERETKVEEARRSIVEIAV